MPTDHVQANRAAWDARAPGDVALGERAWAAEPSWGIWSVPDATLGLLADVAGLDCVELGCGTGYVSAWLTRGGAASVVGLDNSSAQLATAARLQAKHGLRYPLVQADAEWVPLREKSFDFAISEYGAAIWCDPHRWIAEAGRLLRSGGRLVFLGNAALLLLCMDDLDDVPAHTTLQRPQRGMCRFEWPDDPSVNFCVSHGDMIRILRSNGFDVLDLIEVYPTEGATSSYGFVDAEWASQWPSEEIWVAQKHPV